MYINKWFIIYTIIHAIDIILKQLERILQPIKIK